MKKYDKRMLFKIALGAGVLSLGALGLGVFVHSLMRRDPPLNEPLSKGAGSICFDCFDYGLIGEIPTYKIEVPAPRLRMNESKAKETDVAPCYAKNEGVDALSPTEE